MKSAARSSAKNALSVIRNGLDGALTRTTAPRIKTVRADRNQRRCQIFGPRLSPSICASLTTHTASVSAGSHAFPRAFTHPAALLLAVLERLLLRVALAHVVRFSGVLLRNGLNVASLACGL